MNLLGQRLKTLRKEKKLTQSELGKLINVTKVSICCYEKGIRLPSLETLIDLSEIFKVSIDYLLGSDYYLVAENDSSYDICIAKEEILFIKELRKYDDLHKSIISEPKRIAELVNKRMK